jgi:hypothetical protein
MARIMRENLCPQSKIVVKINSTCYFPLIRTVAAGNRVAIARSSGAVSVREKGIFDSGSR